MIGFAGAPFTVACYMVEGHGSRDFAAVRGLAYAEGGRLPVEKYLHATLAERDALKSGRKSTDAVAKECGVSAISASFGKT